MVETEGEGEKNEFLCKLTTTGLHLGKGSLATVYRGRLLCGQVPAVLVSRQTHREPAGVGSRENHIKLKKHRDNKTNRSECTVVKVDELS